MQGLADGYFVLPNTIGDYLADGPFGPVAEDAIADVQHDVQDRISRLLAVDGDRSPDDFHRELGQLMWDHCGMERSEAGLRKALERIPSLREEFWRRVRVLGDGDSLNQSLEKAGRVADFLELTELMCVDALHRTESCGGHFRTESQTPDGEALRDDAGFSYVAAWEYAPTPVLHREELRFDHVTPSQRSYK
jgi:succinate dehydrogenase / fumarate reductase flavoprotein subunit